MSVDLEPVVRRPRVKLIDSDGEPLESDWHVLQIGLLRNIVAYHFQGREDYYAAGNMFVYYCVEQARKRHYRGPDFFFVNGASRLPLRRYWCVWQEGGRYPNFIIELLSPPTAQVDRTTKKDLYERIFRTHEYVCYDPETEKLEGWRLDSHLRYRAIVPDERGWLWIEELGVWLATWQGKLLGFDKVWVRFFDKDGRLIPTFDEASEAKADAAQANADAAQANADAAQANADAEKARADAAEAELRRLKERLAEQGSKPTRRRKGRR
jgi:Uma2 family endonuclease